MQGPNLGRLDLTLGSWNNAAFSPQRRGVGSGLLALWMWGLGRPSVLCSWQHNGQEGLRFSLMPCSKLSVFSHFSPEKCNTYFGKPGHSSPHFV